MLPKRTYGQLALTTFVVPIFLWALAVKKTEVLESPKFSNVIFLMRHTHEKPILLSALIVGILITIALLILLARLNRSAFEGEPFIKFVRGTRIVFTSELRRLTTKKNVKQVTIADVPIPPKLESLHLAIEGATGAGKSVAMTGLIWSSMQRGDRMFIVDPDGEMYQKFGRPGDKILDPYDARTQGWSFFNEIRDLEDFTTFSLSLVPKGETEDAEVWAGYGRLLLREVARKLYISGTPDLQELYRWVSLASFEDLYAFLVGTHAEALFAGSSEASRALSSARFVLSDKLPEHLKMPKGDFSLRTWLEDSKGGNLYIKTRENKRAALKPLVSCWVNTIFQSILSMPPDDSIRMWGHLEELPSLDRLATLEDAAMKGRKHGLRMTAAYQSSSSLVKIYGREGANIIRSCFRSRLVLGGSKTDPATCEDSSRGIGTHDVVRENTSYSHGHKDGRNESTRLDKDERVVTASQIHGLPALQGYLCFAEELPIAKVTLKPLNFIKRNEAFVEADAYA